MKQRNRIGIGVRARSLTMGEGLLKGKSQQVTKEGEGMSANPKPQGALWAWPGMAGLEGPDELVSCHNTSVKEAVAVCPF